MVAGITVFPRSIEQAIEDKLSTDPGLNKQWERVSMRFHLVFAQPQAAFRAVNVDAMLADKTAATTLHRIANEPEYFGALKGKTGIFASKADKRDRDMALLNVPALARNLERYLAARTAAEHRLEAEERSVRAMHSIDIPALSANAKVTLERVRDAIDRNDLPSGLEYALSDKMVKTELEGFARAVSERFGERTFLGRGAKDANGEAFRTITVSMNSKQQAEVRTAWKTMRTAQELATHERTLTALKQAETLRQTKNQGLSLK